MKNINNKQAYPNIEEMSYFNKTHDLNKWIKSLKTLYYNEQVNNANRTEILKNITKDWSETEIYDFLNWLKFYEEGTHLKYKTAQFWFNPLKNREDSSTNTSEDIQQAMVELPNPEKKRIIEYQRNKIIGRLDSAEKLLRSDEGQLFADKELSSLLDTIYELKKKIHMVNKRSSSDKLYNDMIVREANKLTRIGFYDAGEMLYALADEQPPVPASSGPATALPVPTSPSPPMNGSGSAGGLPLEMPSVNNPPDISKEQSKGVDQFLQKLNSGSIPTDKNYIDDDVLEIIDEESDLFTEAQIADAPPTEVITPPAPPAPTAVSAPDKMMTQPKPTSQNKPIIPEDKLEVTEDDLENHTNFDKAMDTVFSNLTIADIVAKFEEIAKFYKTREMPRQLAFADMMLDSLGLAPFFPSLSEATNKALEANNYISSRIEDIIAKLRGTMDTGDIDLQSDNTQSPEIEKTKKILSEQEAKEKARKQTRKELENENLDSEQKETPEIEIEVDLANPVEKVPAAPTPPPPKAAPVPAAPISPKI
jgi:hypothetical protein